MGYVFKAAADAGLNIDPELATGVAVVPIVIGVALALRAVRKRLAKRNPEGQS